MYHKVLIEIDGFVDWGVGENPLKRLSYLILISAMLIQIFEFKYPLLGMVSNCVYRCITSEQAPHWLNFVHRSHIQ